MSKNFKNMMSKAFSWATTPFKKNSVGIEQARYRKSQDAASLRELYLMREVSEKGNSLIEEESFQKASMDERQRRIRKFLDRMVERGLVQKGTVRYNKMQQLITYRYTSGVVGGFLLRVAADTEKKK